RHPNVQSATGPGPVYARNVGKLSCQRIDQGIALFAIDRTKMSHVTIISAARQQPVKKVLREVVRPEIVIALESQERSNEFPRHEAVAGLEPRSTWFGKGLGENHVAIFRIEALDGGKGRAIIAKLTVGCVLHDEDALVAAVTLRQLQ